MLSHNKAFSIDLSKRDLDADKIVQELKKFNNVKKQCTAIDLSNNDLHSGGIEKIEHALRGFPNITSIDLYNNIIEAKGVEILKNVFIHCSKINLGCTGIANNGATELAKVIPHCSVLTELNLYSDEIEAKGAAELAKVLPQCSALTSLDLSYNWICDKGANEFAKVLPQCTVSFGDSVSRVSEGDCTSLKHLDLRHNPIEHPGRTSLDSVLKQCYALSLLV